MLCKELDWLLPEVICVEMLFDVQSTFEMFFISRELCDVVESVFVHGGSCG